MFYYQDSSHASWTLFVFVVDAGEFDSGVSDVEDKTLGSLGTVNSIRLLYSKYSSRVLGEREYLKKDGTNKRERERE